MVPDLVQDTDTILRDPVNIRLGQDIRDTDLLIDNIIDWEKEKGADTGWLYAVKEFSHEDKVKWILSLPDPGQLKNVEESFVFPVNLHFTQMVKVAETVSGENLFEKKDLEKRIEKCIPLS